MALGRLWKWFLRGFTGCRAKLPLPAKVISQTKVGWRKENPPFISIGSTCPIDFYNGKKLLLGSSKFKEISNPDNTVEISRDRCNSLAFYVGYTGRPCSYNTFLYGNIINYEKIDIDHNKLSKFDLFFEDSYGKMKSNIFANETIDYVVISDSDEFLKNNHPSGEGIHCDYIYLN